MSSPISRPAQPIRLYRFELSGHCHRVELMLRLLDLPYVCIDIDLAQGEHKQPAFLRLNPFAQVPAIDDGGTILADSNAILVYLATRYDDGTWLPRDAVGAAHVQRWLSAAAGDLASGPGAARIAVLFERNEVDTTPMIARAHLLLGRMQAWLDAPGATPFLAGPTPTIADIAMFSYTAHAPEGNVSLDAYPAVRAWLDRVAALPRFAPMPASACGLAA